MKLYVVRHGETEFNQKGILQGNSDSALTDSAIKGAKMMGDFLKETDFDMIISSPLGRALKTAEYICAQRKQNIIQMPLVMEMGFGHWQGRSKDEICQDERTKKNYYNFFEQPERYLPVEGAESFESLFARAHQFLDEMKQLSKQKPSGRILLISHGAYIKALLSIVQGKKLNDFWSGPFINNLSITIFDVHSDTVRIESEVDITHLSEVPKTKETSAYLE